MGLPQVRVPRTKQSWDLAQGSLGVLFKLLLNHPAGYSPEHLGPKKLPHHLADPRISVLLMMKANSNLLSNPKTGAAPLPLMASELGRHCAQGPRVQEQNPIRASFTVLSKHLKAF